ncbi:MAG TPA: FAD/NAD(P)-binding oxidoreductase [Bryobacteraceae bacterium]|nr:FAD/NAD(P)-binding oxidoreductase [Bryobacteraceae bacterium]
MPLSVAFDVVVVGAGPAGIAAACAAREAGRSVAVIDDNVQPGGQIWRGGARTQQAARWLERFARTHPKVFTQTRMIEAPAPGVMLADAPDRAIEFRYGKVILATGARERFLPFPGWTLPNVMGAGGLQAMVKGGLPVAGKRVIVAGTGPLLPAVASYVKKHGAEVPLIAEQAPWLRMAHFGLAAARDAGKLRQSFDLLRDLRGVRYMAGCWPIAAEGGGRLEVVVLRRGDRTWREPCDYLGCGYGLVPNLELAVLLGCTLRDGAVVVDEWQQTQVPNAYCCGEPTGVGGVDQALIEGEIAGYAAAGRAGEARRRFAARGKAHRFRAALASAFALRDELRSLATPETIVCRCEDVPLGRIQPHPNWRSAKLQTRCGMGPCQSRICGPAVEFLCGWQAGSARPPVYPARLDRL